MAVQFGRRQVLGDLGGAGGGEGELGGGWLEKYADNGE